MAKREKAEEYHTEYSGADRYIDGLIHPRWERRRVRFPWDYNRKFGNVQYTSEEEYRTYHGEAPFNYWPNDNIQVRRPRTHAAAENLFINNAVEGSTLIPKGYYGTPSGLYPITPDLFFGPTKDHPTIVTYTDPTISGKEFFVARDTETTYSGELIYFSPQEGAAFFIDTPTGVNITTNPYDPSVGRFEWTISPDYQAPVYPDIRYPNGARRRNFFKR